MSTRRLHFLIGVVVVGVALLWGCAKFARHPAEEVYLHKVASGETLEDIAENYYGDPERAGAIGEFNGIGDDTVRTGVVLRVPMGEKDIERFGIREKANVPYNRGLELVDQASYVDAVEQFRGAVAIDPGFADAVYNLGVTLETVKSYDMAKENLEKAVELRPKNAKYRYALGTCLFHLDKFPEAADAFENAVKIDPANTKALYSLAVCYDKLGEKEKARSAWERYLELDSTSPWASEARKRIEELK